MNRTNLNKHLFLAIGAACLATGASAQSLVSTSANILAADTMPVPGLPGVTFGGSGNFDNPVMDSNGRVLFRARLIGTPVTAERALCYGTTSGDLAVLVQSGDQAPGLPGVFMNTASGIGIGGSPRISHNGINFWCASLLGTGVGTTNDTALFGGPVGGLQLLVREGDLAPSGGSTFTQAFNNLSHQGTGMLDSGRYLVQTTLAGGDVVGTTNNRAWISGAAGAPEWVIRLGDTVLTGQVVSALGFISQMNPSGQVLHEETLSTTLGTLPATPANNQVLFLWTPGSGNVKVLQEGDIAPGTAGATFNVPSNSWFVNVGPCAFNASGKFLTQTSLMGGNVTGTNDDTAYYIGDASGLTLALREGDAAPGTDAFFLGMHTTFAYLNNSGEIAFQSSLQGGTSGPGNASGIWSGLPGALSLVAREGMPAPGLPGEFLGPIVGQAMEFNAAGQVYFHNTPTGGSGMSAIFAWTPGVGLTLVVHGGDQVEVLPTVFKTVSSSGGIQFNNGNGNPLSFGASGRMALKVTFTDGTGCILTVDLPSAPYTNFCSPGIGGVIGCPCSNPPSGPGRGCDNSSATGGASIAASGVASLAGDTLSFVTAGELPAVTSILLSGDVATSGVVFGQGVRCVDGNLKRLYIQAAVGGSVTMPGVGEPTVSAVHASLSDVVNAGDHRFYMVYYRDPIVLGTCTPAQTFSGTDAVDVTWTP
jgi:hypothetical protein